MMKRVENHIKTAIKHTFKNYKAVQFSESSKNTITAFIGEFVKNLNKKIDLDKAYKGSRSKEVELIGEIESKILTNTVHGPDSTVESIKELLIQYRGDK